MPKATTINKTDSIEFSGPELATVLNLSVARISQLTKDKTIIRARSGKFPLSAITDYVRWLKKTKPPTEKKSTDLILDQQRALLTAEQLREKKRDNDIADGLVAPISTLTGALEKIGTKIVAQLEALPLEMKRANPRLTGHDIQVVKKSIAKCCNAIAETQL